MTANSTITSFLVSNAQSECANAANSTKTFTSSSSDRISSFSDVLSSANKSYSDSTLKGSSTKELISSTKKDSVISSDKVSSSKTTTANTTNKDKTVDKKYDDNDDKNVSDSKTQDTKKTSDSDNSNKVKDKTEDNDNKNSNKDKSKSDDNSNSKADDSKQDTSVKDDSSKTADTSQNTTDNSGSVQVDNKTLKDADKIANEIIQQTIDALNENAETDATATAAATTAQTAANPANTSVNTNPVATLANNSQSDNSKVVNSNLDVKVSDAAKTMAEMNKMQAGSDKTNLQTQTQQILLNLNQEATSDSAKTAENASQVSTTPTIQVASNVSTLDVGKSSNKQDVQNMLDKAGLTQDLIDKTNAKVVSVTNVSENSTNMSGQQDAAEQSLKLALEQASAQTSQTTSGNSNIQATFDKTLQTAQKGQNISDTEILSQINNKLSEADTSSSTKVTMVLKPESLGKIQLELLNGKDGLTASLTAENAQVKDILDKNLDNLKNNLSSNGINVTNVTVKVDESQKQSGPNMQNQEQNQGQGQGENQHHANYNGQNYQDKSDDSNNQRHHEEINSSAESTNTIQSDLSGESALRETSESQSTSKEISQARVVDYQI